MPALRTRSHTTPARPQVFVKHDMWQAYLTQESQENFDAPCACHYPVPGGPPPTHATVQSKVRLPLPPALRPCAPALRTRSNTTPARPQCDEIALAMMQSEVDYSLMAMEELN